MNDYDVEQQLKADFENMSMAEAVELTGRTLSILSSGYSEALQIVLDRQKAREQKGKSPKSADVRMADYIAESINRLGCEVAKFAHLLEGDAEVYSLALLFEENAGEHQ